MSKFSLFESLVNKVYRKSSKTDCMDGKGQRLFISTHYLGAIKQIPLFLKEIYTLMPNLHTQISISGDLGDSSGRFLISRELEYEQLSDYPISFVKEKKDLKDLSIYFNVVQPSINKNYEYYELNNSLEFWIDPLKFEPRRLLSSAEQEVLREKYNIKKDDFVIVAGSVPINESKLFLDSLIAAGNSDAFSCRRIRALIVPRTYFDEFKSYLQIAYTDAVNDTRIEHMGCKHPEYRFKFGSASVIEEKGVLANLYSISDVAVIGDTFFAGGGQNPIEPAFYGRRMISGPFNRNNDDAYKGLSKSGLLTRVDGKDLSSALTKIPSEDKMESYRKNAAEFIQSKQGAAAEYARVIQKVLYSKS